MTATMAPDRVAIIGFGEAAHAFSVGWRRSYRGRLTAFDLKIGIDAERPALLQRGKSASVEIAAAVADALAGAPVVFSLVTPDQALVAARSAAPCVMPGCIWFDCNSCAPETKRAAAKPIEAAGASYVDVAIMAPVHSAGHRIPLLVSGTRAAEASEILRSLDMRAKIAGVEVGQASAVKMLRSIMVKGMEALTAECVLAARRAGVETLVLESLQASDPGLDWTARSAYNLQRMMVHGERRAAEMREVAATVAALGLPPRLASATAEWQDQIGRLHLAAGDDAVGDRADRILGDLTTTQA